MHFLHFSEQFVTFLICTICSFYPLLVSPDMSSPSDIYLIYDKVLSVLFSIFSYGLLFIYFVILLYLELLKYLSFLLVLLIKCSAATWKFFNSVIANPITKIFLQWKLLVLTQNLQYCDIVTLKTSAG